MWIISNKHIDEQKKPNTKEYKLHDSMYVKFKDTKRQSNRGQNTSYLWRGAVVQKECKRVSWGLANVYFRSHTHTVFESSDFIKRAERGKG